MHHQVLLLHSAPQQKQQHTLQSAHPHSGWMGDLDIPPPAAAMYTSSISLAADSPIHRICMLLGEEFKPHASLCFFCLVGIIWCFVCGWPLGEALPLLPPCPKPPHGGLLGPSALSLQAGLVTSASLTLVRGTEALHDPLSGYWLYPEPPVASGSSERATCCGSVQGTHRVVHQHMKHVERIGSGLRLCQHFGATVSTGISYENCGIDCCVFLVSTHRSGRSP
jgi:hypothetical protein